MIQLTAKRFSALPAGPVDVGTAAGTAAGC